MNFKKWTSALLICAVTLVATTAGIAPAHAANDTAAVGPTVPNLQAVADAMHAATQQLGGTTNNGSNNTQQPQTDIPEYDYIALAAPAVNVNGQVYLPFRQTLAAMKTAALQIEWKPLNQQKIKLTGATASYELYLTPGDTAIQLTQGGTTYPITNQNGALYAPLSLYQAIIQPATIELSGNMIVLKAKDNTGIWNSGKNFWYNMNTYQTPQVDVTYPDTDNAPSAPQPNKPETNTPTVKPDVNVPNNTIGGQIVNNALQYLGVPYVWGGATPEGFDCSGLVQYVYAQKGINLPRTSYEQQTVAVPISFVALQPGDLVFWGASAYHVGIYIGNGKYVHAAAPGQDVRIQSFDEYPFTGAGRIVA